MKRKSLSVESLELRAVLSASAVVPVEVVAEQPIDVEPTPAITSTTPSITPVAIDGDFNADGIVNALDIDLLGQNLGNHNEPAYDLTQDGLVNRDDLDMMIREVIGTEYGDANLDGRVDGTDAQTVFDNIFSRPTEDTGWWSRGDFTLDGIVDGNDFIVWNNFKNAITALSQEPAEPVSEKVVDDDVSSKASVEPTLSYAPGAKSELNVVASPDAIKETSKVTDESVSVELTDNVDKQESVKESVTPTSLG